MRVFPTHLLCPSEINADIERRVVSGGTALSGQEDVIASDGGGRFFVEFADFDLDDRDIALAWRSISATLGNGPVPVIVPIADLRHQFNQSIRVPTSLPFWTEAEYVSTSTGAKLSGAAALRATTISLTKTYLPGPLVAGMWLSIKHARLSHRAYRIAEILAQTATSATITLSHPLREATASDVAVEFTDPRCVCRVDGAMQSPTSYGYSSGSVRFVEDFRESYA